MTSVAKAEFSTKTHLIPKIPHSCVFKFNIISKIPGPSEVTNLKVFAVGSQSMLATWQPPAEQNGNIRGYFVQFESELLIFSFVISSRI
jgi:hypothetical protein